VAFTDLRKELEALFYDGFMCFMFFMV